MIPLYENNKDGLTITHRISRHVSPHIHHHVEMIYVTNGTLELGIGKDLYHMEKGDFALVFPDVIHHYQVFSEKTSTAFYIEARPSLHGSFSTELQKLCPENPIIPKKDLHPDVVTSIRTLFKEKNRNPSVDQAFIQLIFARYMSQVKLQEKSSVGNSDLVYQTVLYIADHFKEELTLDKISKDLGVSKFVLSRVFSGTFHSNFKQYLNDKRLEYSCSMLEDTDYSVTDICMEAGFESQRTFNRVFMEKYRMTPREYRKEYKQKCVLQNYTKVS